VKRFVDDDWQVFSYISECAELALRDRANIIFTFGVGIVATFFSEFRQAIFLRLPLARLT
jgi:hypothetical protein